MGLRAGTWEGVQVPPAGALTSLLRALRERSTRLLHIHSEALHTCCAAWWVNPCACVVVVEFVCCLWSLYCSVS